MISDVCCAKIIEKYGLAKFEIINKGWSGDAKYCVTDTGGKKFLLRVSSVNKAQQRMRCFDLMRLVTALGVDMCEAVDCFVGEDGTFMLQSWIEGRDAEDVIPLASKVLQYKWGIDAGKTLKKIHMIPAPPEQENWASRFNRKTDKKIKMSKECPIQYDGVQSLIEYINKNRNLLDGRPQSFQHGDYHIGNMMIDADGKLVIIDFDRYDFGDPWEEFNRIVWCAQCAPVFAIGMLDGYFERVIPERFWRLLALYIASNTLSSVPWAIQFGQEQVDVMLKQAREVLGWYDNMRNIVPKWYHNDVSGMLHS